MIEKGKIKVSKAPKTKDETLKKEVELNEDGRLTDLQGNRIVLKD